MGALSHLDRRVEELIQEAVRYVDQRGGDVSLRDLLEHMKGIERSDPYISRALTRAQSFDRLYLTSDRRITTPLTATSDPAGTSEQEASS